jgi:hypothetical protein
MKAHTEKEFNMEKLVIPGLIAAAGLASGAVSRFALRRKEIRLANKKIGLVLLGMVIMGTSLEAQQSMELRNCEYFQYRNSSAGPLVDMAYQVDYVYFVAFTSYSAQITIYFKDGSSTIFLFNGGENHPDGGIIFTDVAHVDPKTFKATGGFVGMIKLSGNAVMFSVLYRGTVTYLNLTVSP